MSDYHIERGKIEEFNFVYNKMLDDFDNIELKSEEHLKNLVSKGNYKFYLLKNNLNEDFGYAFIYEIESTNSIWLDYFAIFKQFQSKGLGSIFIKLICEYYKNLSNSMFLEVEIPDTSDEVKALFQIKRIAFYERLGAKILNVNYLAPLIPGGFPMHLMEIKIKDKTFESTEAIKSSVFEIFENIHSDIAYRKEVYNIIFST